MLALTTTAFWLTPTAPSVVTFLSTITTVPCYLCKRAPLRIRFIFGLPRKLTRSGGLIVGIEGMIEIGANGGYII
jgi:hypothetical protein